MTNNFRRCRGIALGKLSLLLFVCCLLGACANNAALPTPAYDGPGPLPALAYYEQLLSRMSPAELGRERTVLAALPKSHNQQLRMAMLLSYPHVPQDLGKAIVLLEGILKASDPPALSLHPLARLLIDNYRERQRQEAQLERQEAQLERLGGQLKESQKKSAELQLKLDGLADIERTLPQRQQAAPAHQAASRGARR